jgi:hypothetical protein
MLTLVLQSSPVVYYFPKNLPPFRRIPRGRGRGDVYARNRGARTGPSPHMVRTSWSRAVSDSVHRNLPGTNREKMAAPPIAKDYWRLPENATIKDVLYAVRSDESTHRFVNHSLGNLEPNDVNPFAMREPDMHVKGKSIEYVHPFIT